jgi:micrococcal nuclease
MAHSRGSRSLATTAVLAAALVVLASLAAAAPPGLSGRVVKLVDGDTIWVDVGTGRIEKVRYIGVNAPEIHHPTRGEEAGGRAAAAVNRSLVAGRQVRLEPDVQLRDRYGRLLAYVWVRTEGGAELMVNAELLRRGYAQVMTVPPNVRHVETFRRLEREARAGHVGLWHP